MFTFHIQCAPLYVGPLCVSTVDPEIVEHVCYTNAKNYRQGLTLVHFSAQLEPCLTQKSALHTPHTSEHPLHTGYTTPYVHPLSHTKRSS